MSWYEYKHTREGRALECNGMHGMQPAAGQVGDNDIHRWIMIFMEVLIGHLAM
jgi:hypothetical protein